MDALDKLLGQEMASRLNQKQKMYILSQLQESADDELPKLIYNKNGKIKLSSPTENAVGGQKDIYIDLSGEEPTMTILQSTVLGYKGNSPSLEIGNTKEYNGKNWESDTELKAKVDGNATSLGMNAEKHSINKDGSAWVSSGELSGPSGNLGASIDIYEGKIGAGGGYQIIGGEASLTYKTSPKITFKDGELSANQSSFKLGVGAGVGANFDVGVGKSFKKDIESINLKAKALLGGRIAYNKSDISHTISKSEKEALYKAEIERLDKAIMDAKNPSSQKVLMDQRAKTLQHYLNLEMGKALSEPIAQMKSNLERVKSAATKI